MPAIQRGQVDGRPGNYRLRWYDPRTGRRPGKKGFKSKSAARTYFREVVEPTLYGLAPKEDVTGSEFAQLYLERHACEVRPRTIRTLR